MFVNKYFKNREKLHIKSIKNVYYYHYYYLFWEAINALLENYTACFIRMKNILIF